MRVLFLEVSVRRQRHWKIVKSVADTYEKKQARFFFFYRFFHISGKYFIILQ